MMPQRSGIRLRATRGHPEVAAVMRPFVRWLRREKSFPVRVPVYLLEGPAVRTSEGMNCSASFFGPDDHKLEPYIRIATGEFPLLVRKWGRRRALVSHLLSLAHELVHYDQWLARREFSERGVVRAASSLVQRYLSEQASNPRLEPMRPRPRARCGCAAARGSSTGR